MVANNRKFESMHNGEQPTSYYSPSNPSFTAQKTSTMSTMPRSLLRVSNKSSVHKVAGSIAHSIRANGSVDVQAIGAGAVNQSIKAIALAKIFLEPEGTHIVSVPEMIDLHENGQQRTAIRILVNGGT
jgi:stage V sporulation protein S